MKKTAARPPKPATHFELVPVKVAKQVAAATEPRGGGNRDARKTTPRKRR